MNARQKKMARRIWWEANMYPILVMTLIVLSFVLVGMIERGI